MNEAALTLRAFNALFPDEDAARAWFEGARWPDGPFHLNRKADACLERMALLTLS